MNVEPSFRLQPCLIQIYISKTTFYLLANKPSLDMNVEPSFRLPSNVSYRRQLSLSPKYSLKIVAVGGTFDLTSARAGPKIVSTCKREGPEIVLIRTAHQFHLKLLIGISSNEQIEIGGKPSNNNDCYNYNNNLDLIKYLA